MSKTIPVNFKADQAMVDAIAECAKTNKISKSAVVQNALAQYLGITESIPQPAPLVEDIRRLVAEEIKAQGILPPPRPAKDLARLVREEIEEMMYNETLGTYVDGNMFDAVLGRVGAMDEQVHLLSVNVAAICAVIDREFPIPKTSNTLPGFPAGRN
jgi:hypothetical protein